ncbi:dihydrouridine synthase-domain-containing protein, partial [Protomyces lactucae-debilis]
LRGRAWYESLGSPKHIVAPMVDGSEYAWRVLSRRYGATLCYSPMMHAKNFSMSAKARKGFWSSMQTAKEEKLIVQFCANEPEVLLQAAKEVEPYADGVDINFGCPQGIAKRGRYGAFLQDEWDVVYNLINILHKNLSIPVTAKIRIFDDRERTLAYARMVLSAGANILSVHCRTREQKGHHAGLGDWSVLKYLRENLPAETVLFANGNVLYYEDIDACLKYTGFDGMMVAETNLHNPGIFKPNCYPRVDEMMKEYLDLLVELDDDTSWLPVKAHLFRLAKPALMHHIDLRDRLGRVYGKKNMEELWAIHKELKERIDAEIASDTGEYPLVDGYRNIPWYRCQPYYR